MNRVQEGWTCARTMAQGEAAITRTGMALSVAMAVSVWVLATQALLLWLAAVHILLMLVALVLSLRTDHLRSKHVRMPPRHAVFDRDENYYL